MRTINVVKKIVAVSVVSVHPVAVELFQKISEKAEFFNKRNHILSYKRTTESKTDVTLHVCHLLIVIN